MPEKQVSKAEAIKIILEAFFKDIPDIDINKEFLFEDIKANRWYAKYFDFAYKYGILEKTVTMQIGDNIYYDPLNKITKGEVTKILFNSIITSLLLNSK